jgi:hypothetical protein
MPETGEEPPVCSEHARALEMGVLAPRFPMEAAKDEEYLKLALQIIESTGAYSEEDIMES